MTAARRALALFSGGLDSVVAAQLLLDQGIEVVAVHCLTPFFSGRCEPGRAAPQIEKLCSEMGLRLEVVSLGLEYLEIVRQPRFGLGKNLNPCMDCHILFLQCAAGLLPALAADFVITGEVLGQRPMSQRRDALHVIERESGLKGKLLRPLSAKLLPPTEPELQGWVDRDKLLDISGRGRKTQIEIAQRAGITGFSSPAGGCLLTDAGHSRKLRLLLDSGLEITLDDLELLKLGRHFILGSGARLVVARNESENDRMQQIAAGMDWLLEPLNFPGPLAALRGNPTDEELTLAARAVLRYGDAERATGAPAVKAVDRQGQRREIDVSNPPADIVFRGHLT